MMVDICSQEDIEFVRSFRTRILNQTDPVAMLRKQSDRSRPASTVRYGQQARPSNPPAGCLCGVALFLVVVACAIAFLI
jgi:hypothetical protein